VMGKLLKLCVCDDGRKSIRVGSQLTHIVSVGRQDS